MIKYYAIFGTYVNTISIRLQLELMQGFKNQFDTREECINFMLNPENSHLFNENEEYTVMEIFKKLPKNKENEPK